MALMPTSERSVGASTRRTSGMVRVDTALAGTHSTETGASWTMRCDTEPYHHLLAPVRWWVPTTMRSASSLRASATRDSAGRLRPGSRCTQTAPVPGMSPRRAVRSRRRASSTSGVTSDSGERGTP